MPSSGVGHSTLSRIFVWYTFHSDYGLKLLMQTKKTKGKLERWSLLLQEYDKTVTHKRGALNTIVDCLSRFPKDAPNYAPILLDRNKGDYKNSLAIVSWALNILMMIS